jgi:hypothetical protein
VTDMTHDYDEVLKLQQKLVSELTHRKIWNSTKGDTIAAATRGNYCIVYCKRAEYTHIFPLRGDVESHIKEYEKAVRNWL